MFTATCFLIREFRVKVKAGLAPLDSEVRKHMQRVKELRRGYADYYIESVPQLYHDIGGSCGEDLEAIR